MTLATGQMLQDRYRIVSLLGQGGMGAVYKAWDTRLNVSLAIKEMIPQPGLDAQTLEQLRRQFQQEAQVLARLSHSNLVRVTDYFQESGNSYLVMDFVGGESLDERIARDGALPEDQVLEWSHQLLDALDYCHHQGIIHRDIKPQNVIIRSDGRAVLVDFGLVKLWDPNDPRTKTAMRGMGTPEYAPPEQYDTHTEHTDPRSDVYGLGATIYHALTGQAPPTATMRIADPDLFQPPRSLSPRVSDTMEKVIMKATALAVGRRFATAKDMDAALRGETPVSATVVAPMREKTTVMAEGRAVPVSKPIPVSQPKRIPTWVWAVGGFILIAIIGGVVGALILGGGSARSNDSQTRTAVAIAAQAATDTNTPSPTPSPSPQATDTPAPSPSPTDTPSPTRTSRPTSTPKGTPGDTPTPSKTPTTNRATPSPSSTAGTPRATNTPRATSAPAASGALITFEQWSSWRRGDQPYGELSQTSEQVHTGSYAAKLRYFLPGSGDDYVVFLRTLNLGGEPNTIGAWVYGDGSGHMINAWIQDAQNEVWSIHLGRVGSAGWQQVAGNIDANRPWPSGHISGPENGAIDYPIKFYGLVLDRTGGSQNGQIYIDDISAWRGTVRPTITPAPAAPPTTAPGQSPTATPPPPPSGQAGRIFYTIEAGQTYYLGSTDPGWSQGQVLGPIDYAQSTCAGGSTATTLAGQAYNLAYGYRCGISHPKDCPAPDGVYKVTLWEDKGNYSISVYRVADNTLLQNIYNGPINSSEPILWSPDSAYFYFTIDHTLHRASPMSGGYQPVLPTAYEPYISPDGSMIVYRQPVGTVGAYDIWVASLDGSNQRNVTNAPTTYKLCARWGR